MKKLKEKLNAKLSKNGGFTLIEMLIVVAIIAILIAIAIPMVNSALERAREATDQANERAAIGMAMVEVLANKTPTVATKYYYEVEKSKGTLTTTKPTDDKKFNYGKGTAAGDIPDANAGKGIVITYTPGTSTADSSFDAEWKLVSELTP